MNSLLIHNDNIQSDLFDKFENNNLAFSIPSTTMMRESFSFDYEAHLILEEWFKGKNQYDTIIIPYNLSNDNYLELTGLRIAAHIRLTPEFNNIYTPIIFIGYETKEQIAKLSDFRTLLFTAGIFTKQKQDFLAIEKQIAWILKNKPRLSDTDYKKFLEIINIQPPANYTSHHSIDNEWALYKWAEYTKCANEIPEIKNRLESGLYFKFLKRQKSIPESEEQKEFIINGKAKILLIDDEAEKGWDKFYQHFFNYSPKITFKSLSIDYKLLNAEQIIEKANSEIKNFNPELVLLDLRLTDSDFIENNKPEDFSGYKILKTIKEEINAGIQVIITTASNKVWNFLALNRLGADGYIVKSKDSDVKEDITQLKEQVELCIQNSYLKDIYKKIKVIKKILKVQEENVNITEFYNRTNINLDIAFELLKKSQDSLKYKNYGFLQLFQIIEDFISLKDIFDKSDDISYVIVKGNRILVLELDKEEASERKKVYKSAIEHKDYKYTINNSNYQREIDTNFKVASLLIFRYGFENSNELKWNTINNNRNRKAAHGGKNRIITNSEIIILLDFLIYILDDKNQKETNIEKGLKEISEKEKLKALLSKYKK